MLRRLRSSAALAILGLAALSLPSAAETDTTMRTPLQAVVQAAPDFPAPAPHVPISLTLSALAGVVGATARVKEEKKAPARKVNLRGTYLFEGISYGPGNDVEVPEGFPEIDGETGDVVHPEGSRAARNQARARSFGTAPNTGGVDTGEGREPEKGDGEGEGGPPVTPVPS